MAPCNMFEQSTKLILNEVRTKTTKNTGLKKVSLEILIYTARYKKKGIPLVYM